MIHIVAGLFLISAVIFVAGAWTVLHVLAAILRATARLFARGGG
jgi:hypothetical protein